MNADLHMAIALTVLLLGVTTVVDIMISPQKYQSFMVDHAEVAPTDPQTGEWGWLPVTREAE